MNDAMTKPEAHWEAHQMIEKDHRDVERVHAAPNTSV